MSECEDETWPDYLSHAVSFSHTFSLASQQAVIIERSRSISKKHHWKLAKVVGFDNVTGAHSLSYASDWTPGSERTLFNLVSEPQGSLSVSFSYSKEPTKFVLAAREYYILERNCASILSTDVSGSEGCDEVMAEASNIECSSSPSVGTRVQSNCGLGGAWDVYTVLGARCVTSEASGSENRFILVSDSGEVHSNVPGVQLRNIGNEQSEETSRRRRPSRDERGAVFPFFASRLRSDTPRGDSDDTLHNANRERALKRSWSALALNESMCPVDLNIPDELLESQQCDNSREYIWEYRLGDRRFRLLSDALNVECPPLLGVRFGTQEKIPGANVSDSSDKTFVQALIDLQKQQEKFHEWPPKSSVRLFFSIQTDTPDQLLARTIPVSLPSAVIPACGVPYDTKPGGRQDSRCRKLSSRSIGIDDEAVVSSLCDGIDELCMQCMEVISLLAECTENNSVPKDKDDSRMAGFANANLSKKLNEQLDDPLCVVSGVLPEWCVAAPAFAPRLFSYDSRRSLLERAAFGVSRSTLKQQEAKVNVGRLRQRMASLRSRAVELVGEAFSGGAEDPTALQLQADELYGMEETLATRVRAAFRAAKWQEHSLQVAKTAVRRDNLLSDAALIMDRYANDPCVCRRRLEVRFDGESGFDAASGEEAGVTRGFYADVAEALLSAENVAGIYCASNCSYTALGKSVPMDIDAIDKESMKLPLWIPDFDSSSQVIIPTPRADKRSSLGVFPRPIPSYHPQLNDVLQKFRFIGRLFAAAMRDGFMFPLPLSASFLKLVQHGKIPSSASSPADPVAGSLICQTLSSNDLPRPGFLGGEIYAAESFVCRALDELDSLDPPLSHSELQRRYEEIETDKNFGRVALGKSYDLSFKEYFEDRSFVDPLDPAQGEDAVPLCPQGHTKQVTIYNIREWVALVKIFVLHEGVIAQALSFRQGVDDFFNSDFLRLFTAEEIQRDVCGTGGDVDNWDESAVRKLFKLDGKFLKLKPIIFSATFRSHMYSFRR